MSFVFFSHVKHNWSLMGHDYQVVFSFFSSHVVVKVVLVFEKIKVTNEKRLCVTR